MAAAAVVAAQLCPSLPFLTTLQAVYVCVCLSPCVSLSPSCPASAVRPCAVQPVRGRRSRLFDLGSFARQHSHLKPG
ncbi:hypothetical protein B0J11DRAFT_537176 [Dendryphion nanum]|uniref:Secreted protein n=1 Tax=Dendryphion nanum TaxID=256645 RepID=A0A9P9DEV4_9PLEO|nr:hypothetical protein B0J11DRAFT_537176 [Dendryphion nanum]